MKVKEVAEAKGISMTKLHIRSEIAYSTIQQIYRNPYTSITLITLARLGEALDVSSCELIEDELGEE